MSDNHLYAQRRAKLTQLRKQDKAYPNDFRRDMLAAEIHEKYAHESHDALKNADVHVCVAGRMMTCRIMGKAAFAHIQDMSAKIQLYVKQNNLADGKYAEFKQWDSGDILGACGKLFKTKTGELSVQVNNIRLLTKSLHSIPEKFHGLVDQETRYRQRYLDLVANPNTRRVFAVRSTVISHIRNFLQERGFIEVETPMMHLIPGGATARPFTTYHHALDMQFFLRIAPELYLKRLVIGGMERVFEINRSFRNEGLSPRHNPEFTMLEFYQAYADYHDLMNLTEVLLSGLLQHINGSTVTSYQGEEYDLGKPFQKMTLHEAILHFNHDLQFSDLDSKDSMRSLATALHIPLEDNDSLGKIQLKIFEKTVEPKLMMPTFITAYPADMSPLAKANQQNPAIADRFELFIGGREIANGFSELNDPDEQAQRFQQQVAQREEGDAEAMYFDQDYITALEYGMPPTAGEGIGIDRLVMFLTDSPTIRDVILFPLMRTKLPVE